MGLPPVERWRDVPRRARGRGAFVGVDEERFPGDYATFVRYHTQLREVLPHFRAPEPLTLGELDAFLGESAHRYPVRFA